jgi:predicted ATP-grasp superfamily ATP-dependent carboligase
VKKNVPEQFRSLGVAGTDSAESLLIIGASTRAAAFSALRTGVQPWCLDLFADRDLRMRCHAERVPRDRYPDELPALATSAPTSPWIYTGGLENWPELVSRIAKTRPLLGNDAVSLALARDPVHWSGLLREAGLPCPLVLAANGNKGSFAGRQWLRKPLRGAGGRGVAFARDDRPHSGYYLQEYIAGEACSAIYAADAQGVLLLGATQQLVGTEWLHAPPFGYCGSIGPLPLTNSVRADLEKLGGVLSTGCRLHGVFGVDYILRDGQPWPVEINPRYTASIEVIELATGISALGIHQGTPNPPAKDQCIGKAFLFASKNLRFPPSGPWEALLRDPPALDEIPSFADIPAVGEQIDAGWPILTFFTSGKSVSECMAGLCRTAGDLNGLLLAT